MDYFFVEPEDVRGHELVLRGDESKHAARVLRKSAGERIFVTDGNDTMFEVVIQKISASETVCDISAIHRKYNEPAHDITLAVSLLKNPARFDYLVEKATELGIRSLIPLICERTIPRKEKSERLSKIALAAMKQCGRSWCPRIQPHQQLHTLIGNSAHWPLRFIPHEKANAGQSIQSELHHSTEQHGVLVVIGPEGGFTEHEVMFALRNGFKSVTLGTRRLRTETAAVVALSQIM